MSDRIDDCGSVRFDKHGTRPPGIIGDLLRLLDDVDLAKALCEQCPECGETLRITIGVDADDPETRTMCFQCGFLFDQTPNQEVRPMTENDKTAPFPDPPLNPLAHDSHVYDHSQSRHQGPPVLGTLTCPGCGVPVDYDPDSAWGIVCGNCRAELNAGTDQNNTLWKQFETVALRLTLVASHVDSALSRLHDLSQGADLNLDPLAQVLLNRARQDLEEAELYFKKNLKCPHCGKPPSRRNWYNWGLTNAGYCQACDRAFIWTAPEFRELVDRMRTAAILRQRAEEEEE